MGEDDEEIMASIEAYPSQNLEQIFPNDVTHIQLARMTMDDDPKSSTINDNFDEDNQDKICLVQEDMWLGVDPHRMKKIDSFMGTHQSVEVQLPQSELMLNLESSSHDGIHATSATHSESRRSPHHEFDVGVVRQTCLRVQHVFAARDATKVCTKRNAEGQPIEEFAGLLPGFLGEIASNFYNFPIMYETWKKVPRDYKNTVYKETIKAKFDVNDQEHKKYILASLGKKWRDTQCRLFHKNYKWEISVEENCRIHPPEINPDHWRLFVQFRTSPKQMEISNKNAANHEKLLIPHTLGSKTLARKRDELEVQYGGSSRGTI
ncbi:putative transposase, Ptta/En/Spm, plant [Sesbania bispinosa]|nr:putative transposase, Ptta/En/Spm, plant [Sesbania bispinosa]